jgi:hypothetical protein
VTPGGGVKATLKCTSSMKKGLFTLCKSVFSAAPFLRGISRSDRYCHVAGDVARHEAT